MRKWISLCEWWKKEHDFLYHGTYYDNVPNILANGLDPSRSESSLDAVFLTDDVRTAENYHSMKSWMGGPNQKWTVLKIDVSKLDKNLLGPDNYELTEMLRHLDEEDPCYELEWSDCSWEDSLRICNQCSYHGVIPPEAISK